MIISRTPFRISFFGGGTDHPVWYRRFGGSVLSTTIDKYCYVSVRHLPPFFEHKHRIAYSRIEQVKHHNEIKHPVVRECIKFTDITEGLEVHYDADLPARAGMGTSSAFTVGLLNSLYGLKGQIIDKKDLAKNAITVEQEWINETVGSQDQMAASFGGLNKIVFQEDGEITVNPVMLPMDRMKRLNDHLMLFFTSFSRIASEVETEKIKQFDDKEKVLKQMSDYVDDALNALVSGSIDDIGKMLHENWMLKRSLASNVSTQSIDTIYDAAREAGAIGGKLLGAGGGGFILFFVPPERQQVVREVLSSLIEIPFRFDNSGSQIVFYKPDIFKA